MTNLSFLFIEVRGTNQYIHNGLAYIAGALEDRVKFEIIDLNYLDWSEQKLLDYVNKFQPSVVGFSVKSTNVEVIDDLIKKIKNLVNCKTVVGGAHVTLLGEKYLKSNKAIDYGLQFEAERSFNFFLDYLENKIEAKDVPGLVYKEGDNYITNSYSFNYHLDELSIPDFSFFHGVDLIEYFKKNPYPLLTSRGCPYHCIYCSVKYVSGTAWRPRSVNNIIDELIFAKNHYQIKNFEMVDDNFTMDVKRAINFCQTLIDRNLNFEWGCPNGIRADRISKELAEKMYQAGCHYVSLGIESGDEEVFDNIKKGEKLEDITRAAKMLMDNKIKVAGFFIVGLPYDNLQKTKKTIKFIEKLKLNGGVKWNFLIPYPRTELWDWVHKNGKILKDFSQGRHFYKNEVKIVPTFETDDFTAKQRIKAWKLANLSTSSYSYVFKIPKSKLLLKFKIIFYLLYYAPNLFISKLTKKFQS